jgi:hypothetical protein
MILVTFNSLSTACYAVTTAFDVALAVVLAVDVASLSACAAGIAIAEPTPRNSASAPTLPTNLAYPGAGRIGSLWLGERITPPGLMW